MVTGPFGFGIEDPIGHLDFYANGGEQQPGCEAKSLLSDRANWLDIPTLLVDVVSCSHLRVVDLYADSIINSIGIGSCPFLAYPCDDYDSFAQGGCISHCDADDGQCARLGIHPSSNQTTAKMTGTKHYFNTAPSPPFCRMCANIFQLSKTLTFLCPFSAPPRHFG